MGVISPRPGPCTSQAWSIGIHISFQDAAGEISDLQLFEDSSQGSGLILQILTSNAGSASVVITAETTETNQSISQNIQVCEACALLLSDFLLAVSS